MYTVHIFDVEIQYVTCPFNVNTYNEQINSNKTTARIPTDICTQLPTSTLAPGINFKMSVDVCNICHDSLPVWSLCRYHLVHVLSTIPRCNAMEMIVTENCINKTTGTNSNIKTQQSVYPGQSWKE